MFAVTTSSLVLGRGAIPFELKCPLTWLTASAPSMQGVRCREHGVMERGVDDEGHESEDSPYHKRAM